MNELLEKLSLLECAIDELREKVVSIQKQMTARIARAKIEPITPSEDEWLARARVALNINKSKLRELNIQRDKLNREIKAAKKKYAADRNQYKNSLFLEKLKELMTEEELSAFLTECDNKVDEATFDEN